jgi:hypothetical protein
MHAKQRHSPSPAANERDSPPDRFCVGGRIPNPFLAMKGRILNPFLAMRGCNRYAFPTPFSPPVFLPSSSPKSPTCSTSATPSTLSSTLTPSTLSSTC